MAHTRPGGTHRPRGAQRPQTARSSAHAADGASGRSESRTVAAEVKELVGRPVLVLTCDGRVLVGLLRAFDPVLNVVLARCHERVFSADAPVAAVQLGRAFLVRGDNVAVLAPLDEELDVRVDYERLCAEPLRPILH